MATVLLVDDEADLLATVARVFQRAGMELATAASGPAGLARLAQGGIDVIVSDYTMPGMDGIGFLREAAVLAPSTPRVLWSGHSDYRLEDRAREAGAIQAFVPKGLEIDSLLDAVRRLLPAHSATASNPSVSS